MEVTKSKHHALSLKDLANDEQKEIKLLGKKIVLYKNNNEIYAYSGICHHMGRPLIGGRIKNHILSCPWHAGKYDIRTGAAVELPAFKAIDVFPVSIIDDQIYIDLTEALEEA